MSPPKILLFDLGGVIVRWTGVANLAALSGLSTEQVTHRFSTSQVFHDYECGRCGDDVFASEMIRLFALNMTTDTFKSAWQSWVEDIYDGIEHILPALRHRYTLACLSNTNHLHWEHLGSYFDFDTYFDYSFASHRVGLSKPDPDIYRHVTEEMNTNAGDILFFDDTAINVEAAENTGMRAIQVDAKQGAPLALLEYGIIERDFWWRAPE